MGEDDAEKTALHTDTMACAPTGRGHRLTEAGVKRNSNITITVEIVSISAPKWDRPVELKSKRPAIPFSTSLSLLLFLSLSHFLSLRA